MNPRLKLTVKHRAEAFKTAQNFKVYILIGSFIVILSAAAILYSAAQLKQLEGIKMKTISLVLCVMCPPGYIITVLICECYRARKEQQKIKRMVCRLTEDICSKETRRNQANHNSLIKDPRAETTESLIHRIVQFINA